jgi:branched-subunit amino acid transport protein
MDLGLIPLVILMAAATYPWRAVPLLSPAVHRLPPLVRDYLRLVGPAMLATLAAVNVMVVADVTRSERTFHVGVEWLAVAVCAAIAATRRSLLIGLVGGVAIGGVPGGGGPGGKGAQAKGGLGRALVRHPEAVVGR